MNKLLVLSKHNCRNCEELKLYLNNNNIEYDSVNIQEDIDVAVKYGAMSVPVALLLNDEGEEIQRSIGFRQEEIQEIIAKVKGE